MPSVRWSGLVSEVRGTVGGVTCIPSFSSGRLRRHSRPRPERSVLQAEHRARLAAASAGWGELSEAQRAAWREWADEYNHFADPNEVPTVSGRGRFIGQYLLRDQAGLSPLGTPSMPGIGNAATSFLRFLVDEAAAVASAESSVPYPTPPVAPATCLVQVSPPQPLTAMHFRRRWRHTASFPVTDGGPGVDRGPEAVPLLAPLPKGYGCWFRTRVVTGAGNTSSEAMWPYLQPAVGDDRAFRLGPRFFLFTPQQVRVTATELLLDVTLAEPYDTTFAYSLTAGATSTIGGLFDTINAEGLWGAWHLNGAAVARPSTDLYPVRRARPIVESQPVLLTLAQE
ncbi:MAG: hypothetical protein LAT56_12875 [Wenzhouxiangella sp.]|nr:hypothetical protein [Wenzhouxiangella sp.]